MSVEFRDESPSSQVFDDAAVLGRTPVSGMLTASLVLIAGCLALPSAIERVGAAASGVAARCFSALDGADAMGELTSALRAAAGAGAGFCVVCMSAALGAVLVQRRIRVSMAAVVPSMRRMTASGRVRRGIGKATVHAMIAGIVLAVGWAYVRATFRDAGVSDVSQAPGRLMGAMGLMSALAGCGAVIGVAHAIVQQRGWRAWLAGEAGKQRERGSGRRQGRGGGQEEQNLARSAALAHLVVTGGGHAVALRYQPGVDASPRVVVSAGGWQALRLCRGAADAGVAVVEQAELAAEMRGAAAGWYVPEQSYEHLGDALRQAERVYSASGQRVPWLGDSAG